MAYSPRQDLEPSELRIIVLLAIPLTLALLLISAALTKPPAKHAAPPELGLAAIGGHVNYVADPDKAQTEVTRLAKASGGNFLRLSDDDQRWLDGMTAGHGAQLIAKMASRQTRGAGKTSPKHPMKGGTQTRKP